MEDNNSKPVENSENGGNDPIPSNTFLIREGVKAIPLDKASITIGRSHDNMIVVDDPRVSRHHAMIRVIRGNFVIIDLASTGGTYLNGERTSQRILYSGDLISLAGVNFVFSHDTQPISPGTDTQSVGPGMRDTAIFDKPTIPEDKVK